MMDNLTVDKSQLDYHRLWSVFCTCLTRRVSHTTTLPSHCLSFCCNLALLPLHVQSRAQPPALPRDTDDTTCGASDRRKCYGSTNIEERIAAARRPNLQVNTVLLLELRSRRPTQGERTRRLICKSREIVSALDCARDPGVEAGETSILGAIYCKAIAGRVLKLEVQLAEFARICNTGSRTHCSGELFAKV